MSRKFKKLLKNPRPKIKDVHIMVSQYLKDIGLRDMDPNEVGEKSTQEELMHNFMLARCWYGRQYNIRFNKKGNTEPPEKVKGIYWISYTWDLYKYEKSELEWVEIDLYAAMIPGTRNIFEDENQRTVTTEDLYKKIQKLKKEKEKDPIDEINELEDLIDEAESSDEGLYEEVRKKNGSS